MAHYVSTHTLPGFTREMLEQASPALEALPRGNTGATFIRAATSFSEGRVVCEMEAPSKESVAAAYAQLGFPYDDIVLVDAICVNDDRGVNTTNV